MSSKMVLVPASMLLDKETISAINFHCGDGGDNFGEHSDGLLWVGTVTDDDGKEVYGLHLATAEYPEEGSTTLVEFAAPVVERQPACYVVKDRWGVNAYLEESSEALKIHRRLGFTDEIPLYTAPPELAELQATIARLTAENEQYKVAHDRLGGTINKLAGMVGDRNAEIERLKGGQGEPVGFRYRTTNGPWEWMDESPYADGRIKHCDSSEQLEPLYASQPAPVSVDLSELREYHAKAISNLKSYADDAGLRDSDTKHYTKRAAFHEEMVALIDKVKELNQKSAPETFDVAGDADDLIDGYKAVCMTNPNYAAAYEAYRMPTNTELTASYAIAYDLSDTQGLDAYAEKANAEGFKESYAVCFSIDGREYDFLTVADFEEALKLGCFKKGSEPTPDKELNQ